jgi:hypothetical protein
VPDSALITLLTGTGVSGVFCILFIAGLIAPRSVISDLKAEITELKHALEAERDRANDAMAGASATRDMLTAFQAGRDMNSGPGH